jgi:dTDP-3-amino-3,4,6-trideoxy-alpha-D-glucose transaminase
MGLTFSSAMDKSYGVRLQFRCADATATREKCFCRCIVSAASLIEERATDILDRDTDFVRISKVQIEESNNGILGIVQASQQIGFVPRRMYFIKGVPQGGIRGAHAHKRLRQCFICLSGGVTLELVRQGKTYSCRLDSSDIALTLEPGCWRNLKDMDHDTIVLVLASDEYDPEDYIRDFAAFEQWERSKATHLPYLDLVRHRSMVALDGPVLDCLDSGQFIGGPALASFEREFSNYCAVNSCVGVGNGLDALTLALRAAGVGPGDEVIVPAHTFIATVLAVDAVGAIPVLADVERETGLLDPKSVRAALTERTRAVIPVHLYGHPVDMDAITEAVAGRSMFILEDAAQAHGARYKGRRCGSLGDAAAFSFYPTKNLGAVGDGGCVTTASQSFAEKVRSLGNYGASQKYLPERLGSNSRLDPIQARVLSAKLPHLDKWNERRRELAKRYFDGLQQLPGLALPVVRPWAEPVWHVFPVRVGGNGRAALAAHLAREGIGTGIHYPLPIHHQPCYSQWRHRVYPAAEAWAASTLSLPLDPTHSDEEIDRVIAAIRGFIARHNLDGE